MQSVLVVLQHTLLHLKNKSTSNTSGQQQSEGDGCLTLDVVLMLLLVLGKISGANYLK